MTEVKKLVAMEANEALEKVAQFLDEWAKLKTKDIEVTRLK